MNFKQLTAASLLAVLSMGQSSCSSTATLIAFGTAGLAISTYCTLKPGSCSSGEAQLGVTVGLQIPELVTLFRSGQGTINQLQAALALVTADVATAQNLPHDLVITTFLSDADQLIALIELAESNLPTTPAAIRQMRVTGTKAVITRGDTVVTWAKPGFLDSRRLDRLVEKAKAVKQ